MPIQSPAAPDPRSSRLADAIRSAFAQLEKLEAEGDNSLQTLAFLLQRVAAADGSVTTEEVDRMETILADQHSLSRPEAVVAVEIARHCLRIADCGCTYEASRTLRRRLDHTERRRLHGLLTAVASADGLVDESERSALRQIAVELGLP